VRRGIAVALFLAACARPPAGAAPSTLSCDPVPYALGPQSDVAALEGSFELTLVASSGDSAGRQAMGRLSLRPARRQDASFVGGTDLSVETVGALRVSNLDVTSDSAPGVAAYVRSGDRPDVLLRFGSGANIAGVRRFEGEYTVLTVHRIDVRGFVGAWRSGALTERAAGHFCARRLDGSGESGA
jgi:hypothetical protein